ncbi:MAG: L-rhamnose mutarotase [Adhaeribacter sp.]
MKRYCFALDLKDDPQLIAEYERIHRQIPAEIAASIRLAGISQMELYRFGTRLFMIMETDDGFSFERKQAMDAANPRVQAWEQQMWGFQQALPGAAPGQKWVLMDQIFQLQPIARTG